jgi:hypothetical protein
MNKLEKPCDTAVPEVYRVILDQQGKLIGNIKKRDGKFIVSFFGTSDDDDCVSQTFAGFQNAIDTARYGCRADFIV